MVRVIPDYFDVYSEVHRRRPTYFEYPAAVAHTAYWHPKRFQRTFRDYLTAVFRFFETKDLVGRPKRNRETPEEVSESIFSYYDRRNPRTLNQELIYEYRDDEYDRVTWRLEVHREYVSCTLIVGVDYKTIRGGIQVEALRPRASPVGGLTEPAFSATAFNEMSDDGKHLKPGITDLLYDKDASANGVQTAVLNILRKFTDVVESWGPRSNGQLGELPHDYRPMAFAFFYGCVAPWTIYASYVPRLEDRPYFPDLDSTGLIPTSPEHDARMRRTVRFMRKIRADLNGDFLNKTQLDSVACYVQNGHAIFVSSLGWRQDEADQSPLHYLLLFNDHPEWEAVGGPSGRRTEPDGIDCAWRLSRLVGNIQAVGTARVASLRNMHLMRNFSQQLRDAENRLQETEKSIDRMSLNSVRDGLMKSANTVRESVSARSNRAMYYQSIVHNITAGLRIVRIPGWLSYDAFISDRYDQSVNYIVGIGGRFSSAIARIGSLYQSSLAESSINLQRVADAVGQVLIVYYLTGLLHHAVKSTNPLLDLIENFAASAAPTFVFPLGRLTKEAVEASYVLIATGLIIALAFGRIDRLLKWVARRSDRPKGRKLRRRGRRAAA